MKRYLHTNLSVPRGFTLVEVMVTLLILSVGLLGLAALQAAGMKYNLSAYQRTQATVLAYDVLDRMRANRAAADAGQYNTALGTPASNYTVNCYSAAANCNPAALASHDLREWKSSLEALLPNGQAGITNTAASGTGIMHHVTVSWIDDRTSDASGSGADPRVVSITVDGEL